MCLHNCTSTIYLPTMEGLQETSNSCGLLRIIAEWMLDTGEVLHACFIDWQKAFDQDKWTTWMQILKGNGLEWHARRLISKLYMDQSVKLRLDQKEKTSVKIEIGARKGCCLSQILFNLCNEYLTNDALEWFGDFKMGEYVICTVKYQTNLCYWLRNKWCYWAWLID